jgi:hypothetical protein
MRLTNTAIKNAQPKGKPYKLSDGGGMYLEVMPNGSKYFRLKYRYLGKEKRLALGVYPTVSLGEAREKAFKAKKILDIGEDPSAKKQESKQRQYKPISLLLVILYKFCYALNIIREGFLPCHSVC